MSLFSRIPEAEEERRILFFFGRYGGGRMVWQTSRCKTEGEGVCQGMMADGGLLAVGLFFIFLYLSCFPRLCSQFGFLLLSKGEGPRLCSHIIFFFYF